MSFCINSHTLPFESKTNCRPSPTNGEFYFQFYSLLYSDHMETHFDMIIVGAGISGIGAAYHLQDKCPGKTYTILESRDALGGTWDLFRYPGIRSDSDMHTLGYKFKPWVADKSIADGPSILDYLEETATENNIKPHIRFNHKVIAANWSTPDAVWGVQVETPDGMQTLTCNFFFTCSGYYDYDEGYTPEFQGRDEFQGQIIHPQHWPENLDYTGKKVIVIGSGATAVTLVPSMAKTAGSITMLQRSPTYMIAQPDEDWIAKFLRKILPDDMAYRLVRKKNVFRQKRLYNQSQEKPEKVKDWLLKRARKAIGPDYDIDTHLTPSYGPWDQRLCLIPNGDLYEALKNKDAEIVTDHIERFDKTGIALKSGQHLDADIIVTATGLNLVVMGGIDISVDGEIVRPSDRYSYEAVMMSGVPNSAAVFGYVNASWTLRADLIAEFVCRLVNEMDARGMRQVTPVAPDGMPKQPWINFKAGYFLRVMDQLPNQGDRDPWLNSQDYARDKRVLPTKSLDDLEFSNPIVSVVKAAAE